MADGIIAYSELNNPNDAIEDVLKQISIKGNPLLIIFSSPKAPFKFYSERFSRAFPKAQVMGCTTYVSVSSKGSGRDGLTAWCITDGIECSSGVILEVTRHPMLYTPVIEKAVQALSGLDNTVGINFNTAGGNCEELVQDTFRSVLEPFGIQIAGGTAGAATLDEKTLVSLNGEIYEEASVFVLIRNLTGKVFVYKENLFKPTKMIVTATDVDCEDRVVYEFDYMPAADALALILGVDKEDLWETLLERPLGRKVGDEIYITDLKNIGEDGSLQYFARIYNQTKVAILEPDVLENVCRKTAMEIKSVIAHPSMTFTINCYSRTLYLERHNLYSSFLNTLKNEYGQYAGMAGFGEQFNYEHFNASTVLVVFE